MKYLEWLLLKITKKLKKLRAAYAIKIATAFVLIKKQKHLGFILFLLIKLFE